MTESCCVILAVLRSERDLETLERILERSNWRLARARSIEEAASIIAADPPGVVVCEESLPDGGWLALARRCAALSHPPLIVVASRMAADDLWCDVLTHGAYDLIAMPFRDREVFGSLAQAWRQWKAGVDKENALPA